MSASCPVCGQGQIKRESSLEEFEYRGSMLTADRIEEFCDACGTALQTPEIIRENVRSLQRARKHHDGLLGGHEIKAFRARYDLSQEVAARLFGGGKVAFSKYESDTVCQSEAMNTLLQLCIENPQNIAWLAERKKVALPKGTLEQIGKFVIEKLREIILREASASMILATPSPTIEPANDAEIRRFTSHAGIHTPEYCEELAA